MWPARGLSGVSFVKRFHSGHVRREKRSISLPILRLSRFTLKGSPWLCVYAHKSEKERERKKIFSEHTSTHYLGSSFSFFLALKLHSVKTANNAVNEWSINREIVYLYVHFGSRILFSTNILFFGLFRIIVEINILSSDDTRQNVSDIILHAWPLLVGQFSCTQPIAK